MSEDLSKKIDRVFSAVYDAVGDFDWDIYNSISNESPEDGWENFVWSLSNLITENLIGLNVDDITIEDHLKLQIFEKEEKRKALNNTISELYEKLKKLQEM